MGGVPRNKQEACCSTNWRCAAALSFLQLEGLEARKAQHCKSGAIAVQIRGVFQSFLDKLSRTNVCRDQNTMEVGICSCKASGEEWRREKFWALLSLIAFEERGTAELHQKCHGIFHVDFHARFQEKISRQHFCKPCRHESCTAWGFLKLPRESKIGMELGGLRVLHPS